MIRRYVHQVFALAGFLAVLPLALPVIVVQWWRGRDDD